MWNLNIFSVINHSSFNEKLINLDSSSFGVVRLEDYSLTVKGMINMNSAIGRSIWSLVRGCAWWTISTI